MVDNPRDKRGAAARLRPDVRHGDIDGYERNEMLSAYIPEFGRLSGYKTDIATIGTVQSTPVGMQRD